MAVACRQLFICVKNVDQTKTSTAGTGWKFSEIPVYGVVSVSSQARYRAASSRVSPHISEEGLSAAHTAGRSGRPKMPQ